MMGKNRLEAFFDGVIAIIITIMVLEMKVPHGVGIETLSLSSVLYLAAIVLAFLSSWIAVAIYVFVALMWVVPDKRIERVLAGGEA